MASSTLSWSQCVLAIGLLKKIKGRCACLPLDFRFYQMKKVIEVNAVNAQRKGAVVAFSDVRRILVEATLDPGFQSICPRPAQTPENSFVETLLRMVA